MCSFLSSVARKVRAYKQADTGLPHDPCRMNTHTRKGCVWNAVEP